MNSQVVYCIVPMTIIQLRCRTWLDTMPR